VGRVAGVEDAKQHALGDGVLLLSRAYEAIAEARSQIADVGAKLKSIEEENAVAAEKKQAEYDKAVELCKLLEENAKEVESKLETADSEATKITEERDTLLVEIATMRVQKRRLEAKIEKAEEATAAAKKKQAECGDSIAKFNKLEKEAEDLRRKLEATETEATNATNEKKSTLEQVAQAKLQITEQEKKISALAQQVQYLEGENFKLLEENVELKELCEEMIAGIGVDAVDC